MSARLSDEEFTALGEASWRGGSTAWRAEIERILAARLAEAEQAAARRLAEVEAERDAYRKAKQENDERFQIEALEQRARAEQAEAALADLRARVEALTDSRGVNVGDDDSEWWQGYRQAQRECWYDAQALRALVAQQRDGGGSDG